MPYTFVWMDIQTGAYLFFFVSRGQCFILITVLNTPVDFFKRKSLCWKSTVKRFFTHMPRISLSMFTLHSSTCTHTDVGTWQFWVVSRCLRLVAVMLDGIHLSEMPGKTLASTVKPCRTFIGKKCVLNITKKDRVH